MISAYALGDDFGNQLALVHMVLNALDFLIILVAFACEDDDIAVLGVLHTVPYRVLAVRHDNILSVGL